MKVVTSEQMREMDRRAIEEFGIPGVVLMENAGRAVVEVMAREYGPLKGKGVEVFCGGGNNGGDGFVIARHLHLMGCHVLVFMVGKEEALKADARVHYEMLKKLKLPIIDAPTEGWKWFDRPPFRVDLVVDALLGTGSKDAPRDLYDEAIGGINQADIHGIPAIAVDIPSGVNADTGATPGRAVQATHTVTFAYPKVGLLTFPGAARVGELHVADIGFPWEALEVETPYRLLRYEGRRFAALFLKNRAADSNKGDYGHVAVIAGSRGMAGAPALTARAAQRVGAGLVTVLAPECVQPTLAAKLDEQMTVPLPDADGSLSEAAFERIVAYAEKISVFCIGPGLTTHPQTVSLIGRLIAELDKPLVLDADGLNALAQNPALIAERAKRTNAPLIITPHPGEAARLLGTSIAEVESNRLSAVGELSRRYQAVSILKGRHTLIAGPSGDIAINTTGNPGMATGGMGDTLTGILGGLLAQGFALYRKQGMTLEKNPKPFREMVRMFTEFGVYLHGRAGDLAAGAKGEAGLIAGDVIEMLPTAIRMLEEVL